MDKLKLMALLALLTMGAMQFDPATDPCLNPNVHKDSVPISIASATAQATYIIATPSPGIDGRTPSRKIYVCGVFFTGAATGSLQLSYGTDACSSTTNLTGAMLGPFAEINQPGIAVPLASASPQALCITVGGAAANIQGVITYVAQ